jgi:hypothetical protein
VGEEPALLPAPPPLPSFPPPPPDVLFFPPENQLDSPELPELPEDELSGGLIQPARIAVIMRMSIQTGNRTRQAVIK